jgi:hypothetical protein
MEIPPFSLVGAAGSKFGSASVGAYMAGFFPEGFLLQPTAAEMASPMPKTIDLKAAFRRTHVILKIFVLLNGPLETNKFLLCVY